MFWSGPKRAPSPITFNADDDLDLSFVLRLKTTTLKTSELHSKRVNYTQNEWRYASSCANLFAYMVNIPVCNDLEKIRSIAQEVKLTVVFEYCDAQETYSRI